MSDSFPFKWINKKWKEGFYVTSMATSHTRWAVVMSRNAGYIDQVCPPTAPLRSAPPLHSSGQDSQQSPRVCSGCASCAPLSRGVARSFVCRLFTLL